MARQTPAMSVSRSPIGVVLRRWWTSAARLAAASVTVGAQTYLPTPLSQNVTVTAGAAGSVGVSYSVVSGALPLAIRGAIVIVW